MKDNVHWQKSPIYSFFDHPKNESNPLAACRLRISYPTYYPFQQLITSLFSQFQYFSSLALEYGERKIAIHSPI